MSIGGNYTEIIEMANELTGVKSKVDNIEKKLDRIEAALLGDGQFTKEGLVHKIRNQQDEIVRLRKQIETIDEKHEQRFKNFKNWLIGACIGGGTSLGVGLTKLIDLITK